MKLRLMICMLFILFSSGFLNAETIDITPDLQKKISQQPASSGAHLSSGTPPVSGQANAMKDIYDIKPIEVFGYDKRILWVALIALAILILIVLVFFLIDYLLKKRKNESEPAVPELPPDLEAYDLLDALENDQSVDVREFYFRLTSIVKGYTGRRFEIDAPEMTIEELLPKINELDLERTLKQDLKNMLTASEPVKFAGSVVVKEQMASDLVFVNNFIRQTSVEVQEPEGRED